MVGATSLSAIAWLAFDIHGKFARSASAIKTIWGEKEKRKEEVIKVQLSRYCSSHLVIMNVRIYMS